MSIASPFRDVVIPDLGVFDYLFGDLAADLARVTLVDATSGFTITYGALR